VDKGPIQEMNYLEYIIGSAVAAIFSGITWLIRRVLTNEKQIALMQAEIRSRDVRRQEDREIMNEIKTDLKEVKRDIIELYKRDPDQHS
jgi:hypothetical protein